MVVLKQTKVLARMSNIHSDQWVAERSDPFNLGRFLAAQQGVYASVLAQLGAGQKRTHWMWFIFPQVAGLGTSETTRYYAIKSPAEASAYLEHPILGARLLECTGLVNEIRDRSARQIFGIPDDMKFRSSMTLFEYVAGQGTAFSVALDTYFGGERDTATIALVGSATKLEGIVKR